MGAHLAKEFRRGRQPPTSGPQSITDRQPTVHAAETVRGYISVYLGPATATAAVTGCCHALGREPESLDLCDVPELLAALRPMLGTLLGDASCRILLHRIAQALSS